MLGEFHCLLASETANPLQVVELSEFIENKLYFMIMANPKTPMSIQSLKDWKSSIGDDDIFYLNVDDNLIYDGFFSDFGPLNLAMVYRYIGIIQEKFKVFKRVVHCNHQDEPQKRSNAAFLICAYMIIQENWTANQAYTVLSQQYKYQYLSFRDASCLLHSEHSVTVEECVNALYKAKWYGFFDFDDFDVDAYEKYETVKFGDMNWIVPGTLLAFSSPHSRDYIDKSGYQIHSPAYYYQYFKENNVKHVVRLNSKKMYDAQQTFVAVATIQHTDMFFTDGTPPTVAILNNFLRLCEQYTDNSSEVKCTNSELKITLNVNTNENSNGNDSTTNCDGAVAVHCKAGLGRTGCLIASYIMKHWSFTAIEAIAWIRICRPGSIIGTQQQWLIEKEEYLKSMGREWREIKKIAVNKYKRFTYGVYSKRQNISSSTEHEYVDPPLQSSISKRNHCSTITNEISEVEKTKSKISYKRTLPSVLKKKMKTNNNINSNTKSDINVPNIRQKRSASKNEDPNSKSLSILKNSRRISNTTNDKNINNDVKLNNTTPTAISTSNSKASAVGKESTKVLNLNKMKSTETTEKIADKSKPSYALATIASSAHISRRLRSQNLKL